VVSQLEPTDQQRVRVVQRGLEKSAPFHRSRNSVADAVLIEIYASAIDAADLRSDPHAFITSNSEDFSSPLGDKREPHPDLAILFADDGSTFGLGLEGLSTVLLDHFGDELKELLEESTSRKSRGDSTRFSKRNMSSSTGFGITDRFRTKCVSNGKRIPRVSRTCCMSPGRVDAGWRHSGELPGSWARVQRVVALDFGGRWERIPFRAQVVDVGRS
jgi:hypothetical protein